VDFAHLHARSGDGSMNTYDEWSRTLEAYGEALGEAALKDLHVHLSGIEYGLKGEKEHLPLQESDLDLRAIFRSLLAFGCGGRLLCESPVMEDDAIYMRTVWSEISGEH
jgi:deoxyribonuclease-4